MMRTLFWQCHQKGPSDEELFQREGDDTCLERGRRRREEEGQRWEERLQENWENCLVSQRTLCVSNEMENRERDTGREWRSKERETLTIVPPISSQELNLSYQDLGDPFQQENFLRILRRLIRVEKLQLVDNSLTNLSSVRLPRSEPHYPECTTTPSPVKVSDEGYKSHDGSVECLQQCFKLQMNTDPDLVERGKKSCHIIQSHIYMF